MSYPHLFQPRAVQQGQEPKYSVAALIRKDDPQVTQIQAAIETEKANGFPSGFPAKAKVCLKDCAVEFPEDPKLANYYVVSCNANAKDKPPVVDTSMQPVMDPAKVYAGAIAWLHISIYPYNKDVNRGIAAGLNGVMLTGEEGELGRLDNKPTVEQMFSGVGTPGMTPPVAPQTPAVGATPPPAPPTPPAAPPASPAYQMTAAAKGATRDQYLAQGWTDELLIQHGLMLPPNGVSPSFSQ